MHQTFALRHWATHSARLCDLWEKGTGLLGSVITPWRHFPDPRGRKGSLNKVPDFSEWENRNQKPKEREVNRNNLQKHPQESLAKYWCIHSWCKTPTGWLIPRVHRRMEIIRIPISLTKAMATHSSTLAWKIPWMEEPDRLQSMGSLGVGHDWVTSLSHIGEGNGNPLQYSFLENPRDGGAWQGAIYGVAQSQTRLKRLSSSSNHDWKRMKTFSFLTLK